MGHARKSLIGLNDTPYYHCVARLRASRMAVGCR